MLYAFKAGKKSVDLYLQESEVRFNLSDVREIVQAAAPIARDMVRDRQ
ncbi:MAG: hypothetical protein ACK5VE_04625 [Alphaproteobacteria bacterium]